MNRLAAFAVALLVFAVQPVLAWAQDAPGAPDAKAQSRALARRIDEIINKRLQAEKMKPGPKAESGQLGRRLHIDLIGRIPALLEARDFLDPTNDAATKVEDLVDSLLDRDAYSENFAHYWRTVMLAGTRQQNVQTQFESWLRSRLASNTRYDKLAYELLTSTRPDAKGGAVKEGGQPAGGSPAAFYTANENKPENLAGATARVLLGVKIECAQCHKHPFAKWTRQQFWEYAAFFSSVAPQPKQPQGKQKQPLEPYTIRIPETDIIAKAKFISGEEPDWKDKPQPRTVLADWVTSPQNPWFARAAVDHVWQYFFGVSLVEPVFEPTDDSPPAHPELLDELAKSFVESGYDLKFLIRSVVLTEAYGRASVGLNEGTRPDIEMFARMPVRGMMPEQLFDSIVEATRTGDSPTSKPKAKGQQPQNALRTQFLTKFTSQDKRTETQTSILQALYLMNSKFINDRCQLENNISLKTIATAGGSTARRVETLYLMVLSRQPRPEELEKLVRHIESGGGSGDPRQAVAEIYWALLNTSEFMLNN